MLPSLPARTASPAPARARLDDAEVAHLVRSAATGDHRAWEALVAEFGGMIFAIARGARLGEADAAEVSQATWTKLLERLDTLNDPARVGAWLATTARRECLRILRRARRQIPYGDDVP